MEGIFGKNVKKEHANILDMPDVIHNGVLHGKRLRAIFALQIVTKCFRSVAGAFAHGMLLHWAELEVGFAHVAEQEGWVSKARSETPEALSARLELPKAILNESGHDIPNPMTRRQHRDICGLIGPELRAEFCLAPFNLVCKVGHEEFPPAHGDGLPLPPDYQIWELSKATAREYVKIFFVGGSHNSVVREWDEYCFRCAVFCGVALF